MVVGGSAIQVLSFGLLYRYRDASQSLGPMIVALVLYGIGGGMFTTLQTGCQASVSHDGMYERQETGISFPPLSRAMLIRILTKIWPLLLVCGGQD